jgi:hypothetical protein
VLYAQSFGSYKNKPPSLKTPRLEVDRVEMKAEIDIKVKPENTQKRLIAKMLPEVSFYNKKSLLWNGKVASNLAKD